MPAGGMLKVISVGLVNSLMVNSFKFSTFARIKIVQCWQLSFLPFSVLIFDCIEWLLSIVLLGLFCRYCFLC